MDETVKNGVGGEDLSDAEKIVSELGDFVKKAKEQKDYEEWREYSVPVELGIDVEPILKTLKKNAYDFELDTTNSKYDDYLDGLLGVDVDREDFYDPITGDENDDAYSDARYESRLQKIDAMGEDESINDEYLANGINRFTVEYHVDGGENRGDETLSYTRDMLNKKSMPYSMTTGLAELLMEKIDDNKSGVETLAEMPSFEEYMAEKSHQLGGKVLEVHGESDGFKQFEKLHPEIATEMRELGVPLNEKEFLEEGFSFYSSTDASGRPVGHLRRETSEFRDWKKEHPNEEPPANMRRFAPIDRGGIFDAELLERDVRKNPSKYPSSWMKTSSGLRDERDKLEKKERDRSFLMGEFGYFMDEDDLKRCGKLGVNPEEIEKRRFQRAKEVVNQMNETEMDEAYETLMDTDIDWNNEYDAEKQRLEIPSYTIHGHISTNQVNSLAMIKNHEIAQKLMLRDIAEGTRKRHKYTSWWYDGKKYEAYPEYTHFLMKEIKGTEVLKALEIDTDDIGVRKRAFVGFAKTLLAKNGEKTDQADWYFETFKFADNWDDFLSAMAGAKENFGAGFQRKFTMFLNRHEEWKERNEKIKEEKEVRKITEKDTFARLGNMREVSLDYINEYVDGLRENANLDGDYFPVKGYGVERMDSEEVNGDSGSNINNNPAYGAMKIAKLGDWCNYIQGNVDAGAKFYIESVGSEDDKDRGKYLALQFTMGDKTYCIAESVKDNEAMYIASDKAGEDVREYFRTLSKREARRDDHVDVIYHLNKENIGDSLDQCYAKAFFLLFGGKKSDKDFGKVYVYPASKS